MNFRAAAFGARRQCLVGPLKILLIGFVEVRHVALGTASHCNSAVLSYADFEVPSPSYLFGLLLSGPNLPNQLYGYTQNSGKGTPFQVGRDTTRKAHHLGVHPHVEPRNVQNGGTFFLVVLSPFSSGILLFKWAKHLENRWFLKRTMGEGGIKS